MRFEPSSIPGVIVFHPTPHHDERGFFSRTFDADVARDAGLDPTSFVQDSISRSSLGVLRGLHVRTGQGEAKLVRCSAGRVFDVVVDLRRSSSAYGRWESFLLSGEDQTSVFIPAGCAHGFQALTEPADTSYRIDRAHDPAEALTVRYDDPQLAIPWPLAHPVLSAGDAAARPMSELQDHLSLIGS